jgi:hypothetical protein
MSSWAAVYGETGNEHAEAQLGLWSTALADINRTFSEIGNQTPITSCYAQLPTVTPAGSFVVCVPHSYKPIYTESVQLQAESSASLDYILEHFLPFSNVSHASMCRFENQEDNNYIALVRRIKAELDQDFTQRSQRTYRAYSVEDTSLSLRAIKEQLVINDTKLDKLSSGLYYILNDSGGSAKAD